MQEIHKYIRENIKVINVENINQQCKYSDIFNNDHAELLRNKKEKLFSQFFALVFEENKLLSWHLR